MKRGLLVILAFVLLVFISCGFGSGSPAHTHSYKVQSNGNLACKCGEEVSSPYIAFINESKAVIKYALLTSNNSEMFLGVSGNNISYVNSSSNTQDVVIKTISSQRLTVNAPNANVTHYGDAKDVNIIAVANSSYTGKANIDDSITVKQGHINLEKSVSNIVVDSTGSVSVDLTKNAKVETIEVKESTGSVSVGSPDNSATINKIETKQPISVSTKVDEIEVLSNTVSIKLTGNADVPTIRIADDVNFTSGNLEITIDGSANVDGIIGIEPEKVTSNKTVHVHTLTHHEGKKASCSATGYEAYDTCECGYSTYKAIPMVDHIPSSAVSENMVSSTCTKKGSYDYVVYCSVCKKELLREKKEIETKPHAAAAAVVETGKASTCTVAGYNYSVVYCKDCHAELSRTKIDLERLAHNKAEAVRENEVKLLLILLSIQTLKQKQFPLQGITTICLIQKAE